MPQLANPTNNTAVAAMPKKREKKRRFCIKILSQVRSCGAAGTQTALPETSAGKLRHCTLGITCCCWQDAAVAIRVIPNRCEKYSDSSSESLRASKNLSYPVKSTLCLFLGSCRRQIREGNRSQWSAVRSRCIQIDIATSCMHGCMICLLAGFLWISCGQRGCS